MCKCGNKKCHGFVLLHEKELLDIETLKNNLIKQHGDVTFELLPSPSSGEMFTKFYELHVRQK